MICEIAPAKINFTLEILNKRNDGYHEIKSLMQTIDLCDMLTFWDNDWLQVIPEYNNLPISDCLPLDCCTNYLNNNLVHKAALMLKEITGYRGGAIIELKKNIPSSAGLGGGSSDAAATLLRGLNKLWRLGLSMEELAEVGSRIGSDIPFFIYGGTCLSTGRGEVIEIVESIRKKWLTIALLPMRISEKTKKLYSHITPSNFSDGSHTEFFLNSLGKNGSDNGNGNGCLKTKVHTDDCIFNVFETVYKDYFDEFQVWSARLNEIILKPFHISGSGPSVFYISDSAEEIVNIIKKLENVGLVKYFAQTVP